MTEEVRPSYPTTKEEESKLEVCPECDSSVYTKYYHNSSWVSFGGMTHALHSPKKLTAVILTTEGWHCRVCKHTWNDSRTSPTTAKEGVE